MRATAWHNGGSPTEPGAYGLKFSAPDRDRHFDQSWSEVVVELDGGGVVGIDRQEEHDGAEHVGEFSD